MTRTTTGTGLGGLDDEALFLRWMESRRATVDGQPVQGEVAAFNVLWRRYHGKSHGLILRLVGPRHRRLAEELVQDAWTEVARARTWDAETFAGWLATVATHKALDALARRPLQAEVGQDGTAGGDASGGEPLPGPETPEELADRQARVLACRRALGQLPAAERAVLEADGRGLSKSEVARTLRIPEGTVASRKERGLDLLAAALWTLVPGVARDMEASGGL